MQQVRANGDAALKNMTKQYDQVDLIDLQVMPDEFAAAYQYVKPAILKALKRVCQQLYAFHEQQKLKDLCVETSPGIICESQARPIQRVGLYVPAGTAPLVSTVLMLGVPAQIAACPVRILCSPPQADGNIDPHILVAAQLCGIEKIYKVGGAQAIAAMAYGTETIPKVDKIFGPGNAWVTQAKMQAAQDAMGALYDLPAGPSEVMVIADSSANPEFVAADLLSQAEHDTASQVMLLCNSAQFADAVKIAIVKQIKKIPRQQIAQQALENSYCILIDTVAEAIAIANDYAPEHLILQVMQPRQYLPAIQNAGSIFLGPWSPEAAGDYASGTNHVLPTYGFAKSLSGLSVRDFMKTLSIQELTRAGLADIAETIRELTTVEGLNAHQQAIDIRLVYCQEEIPCQMN
jgi:histidinol dehydrogenase